MMISSRSDEPSFAACASAEPAPTDSIAEARAAAFKELLKISNRMDRLPPTDEPTPNRRHPHLHIQLGRFAKSAIRIGTSDRAFSYKRAAMIRRFDHSL